MASDCGQVVIAVVQGLITILLCMVALFRDRICAYFFAPKLGVSVNCGRPDYIKILMKHYSPKCILQEAKNVPSLG